LCVALFALSPAAAGQEKKKPEPTPAEKIKAAVKELSDNLREARDLLKKIGDKALREKLELAILRAEAKAAEIDKELAKLQPGQPGAMPADEFAKVLKGLKAESFDDGKVTFVKGLGTTPRFSCAQAKEMLATFSFDGGREKAAVMLHPQVVDPGNFFLALEAFTFESSKNKVREQLKLK
jgi:hypothetical protein